MDKKSMRLLTWHLLPAAYLFVLCAGVNLFVPIDPRGVFLAAVLVGMVWMAVSAGLLLDRLRPKGSVISSGVRKRRRASGRLD